MIPAYKSLGQKSPEKPILKIKYILLAARLT